MGRDSTVATIGLTLASVLVTSLLAFLGALTYSFNERRLRALTPILIACAVGVLVGEACLHLIPESARSGMSPLDTLRGVTIGSAAFALLEQFLRRFGRPSSNIAPVGRLALVAESVHNAIDGALIAGAYIVDLHVGLAATIAVTLHEVPHELGNFGVLIHAGYGRGRALLLNFVSACAAFLGAGAMLAVGRTAAGIANVALPIAAGSFLYLALADLVPDLWRGSSTRQRTASGFAACAGVAFMAVIIKLG
jgi:zinc and cadmium transporter